MSRERDKLLMCGSFSFDNPHRGTTGDLLAMASAADWAREAGYDCYVATPSPRLPNELSLGDVNPQDYAVFVFVCGPLTDRRPIPLVQRFPHAFKIALNVTLIPGMKAPELFDVIIERDGGMVNRPDIALATPAEIVPVIGVCYVGPQSEYPAQRHSHIEEVVKEALDSRGYATIGIDTCIPGNTYGLTTPGQIESVMRATDCIITTRLHGSVLALRQGVPVISIDPVPGGAKVSSQMHTFGWPLTFNPDTLTKQRLLAAVDSALAMGRSDIKRVAARAARKVTTEVKPLFVSALAQVPHSKTQ